MNAKAVPAGLHLAEGTRVTLMARRYINTKRRAKEFKASFLSPGRFTSLETHAKFGNTPYWRLCFSVPNSRKEAEELGHGLSRVLCISNPLPCAAWTPVGSSLQGGAKSFGHLQGSAADGSSETLEGRDTVFLCSRGTWHIS